MNYTSYTAIILTLHNVSLVVTLFLACIASAVCYWIFIRRRKYRVLALTLTFLVSFVVAAMMAEQVFLKNPLNVEIIQAG